MQKLTEKDIIRIIDLYLNQKLSIDEICEIYKVNNSTIFRTLKKNNIVIRKKPNTTAQIKEANRLYAESKRKEPTVKFKNQQINAVWDTLIPERAGVKDLFSAFLYSYEDYFTHIENLLENYMNWDNYGEWVIEHIEPQTSFIFNNINNIEYKKCWSLDNLKPVWLKDSDGDIVNNHLYHDDNIFIESRKHKYILTKSEKKLIIDEYKNDKVSVEKLALKYKIGKLKIKEILSENEVVLNIREKNSDKAKEEYKIELTKLPSENKIFIAVCKETKKEYKDYLNKSGTLSEHILDVYGIESPNNHFKRKYFSENKKHWFEEYFDIIEVDEKETRKCKYCDWETYDTLNKTGCYRNHLLDEHKVTIEQFLIEFPDEIKFENTTQLKLYRENILSIPENSVTCGVCGEKLKWINSTHLKSHNITALEYKEKYGNITASKSYSLYSFERWERVLKFKEHKFTSKAQIAIQELIESYGYTTSINNKKLLGGVEIDIYVEELNLGIEYNGNFYHTEKGGKKTQQFHLNKTKLCNEKGIRLIHIFEDEWILKNDIVISKLKQILGKAEGIKIGGRQCIIKEISSIKSIEFYDKFHIQGGVRNDISLGAFYNNELVACMSFSKHRNMTANSFIKYDFDLVRFATNSNYIISGVGSKLFKQFIKEYNPNSIISFADRRWSDLNKNIYLNMAFTQNGFTSPNYWYYKSGSHSHIRHHKFGFGLKSLKSKGMYIDGLSEWECMQHHGYDRIWDCGLIRYVWTK